MLVSSGSIGSSTSSALAVNTPNLTASATNNSYISDAQSVTLTDTNSYTNGANTSNGLYYLNVTGDITAGNTYTPVANAAELVSSGSNGIATCVTPLAINAANVTANATNGSVYLTNSQAATIVQAADGTQSAANNTNGTWFFNDTTNLGSTGNTLSFGSGASITANNVILQA